MIEEAIDRIDGKGEVPYGQCLACAEVLEIAANPPPKPKPTKAKAKAVGKGAKAPAKPEKVGKAKKVEASKPEPAKADIAKIDPWIPKDRLAYIPWARYCLRHQEDEERNRETA
jgi:hypothetical protein